MKDAITCFETINCLVHIVASRVSEVEPGLFASSDGAIHRGLSAIVKMESVSRS